MSDRLEKKWKEFHESNPHVFELLEKYTFEAIEAGRNNYSINAIFERIRWHTDIETKGDQFKLSNNHRAYYARHFHKMHPKHDGFFRTRDLNS